MEIAGAVSAATGAGVVEHHVLDRARLRPNALAALGAVPARPQPRALGRGAGWCTDLSEKVDDILAEGLGR